MLEDKTQLPVYLYSGQKLRTQDMLQEKQRERLSKDRHATYTYSREFQSLALSMVNPEALRQTEEQEDRKKWTTQRGFIYPAPRQPAEYYKHANAPSEARCEDLRQPFVDNVNHPKPVSRDSGEAGSRKGPEFSTLPSKDMIFGGTNGDGTANSDYFRSVHLCGEGLRIEMEEALKKEQDEWERRLVVDKKHLKFLAHGNICSLPREKPSQLDKISDILKGPTHSKPIRIVKNATLPSGKRVPLEKAPVTIHNQEEYAGCVAATFASTLRPSDSNQFVATDATSGKPKDFFFPSTTNILMPPVKKFVTRKEITPVRETEKGGLVWRNE
ncbi:Glucan 1 [Phytophthora cinnamomi]|uniref:Glucan 1 n=1 Tax=Phytophthora cinnamomi TaxID=4785 RepID=UPI003559B28E|nr:Glucan 1 [Phytophthora cinnamomi]